MPMTYHTLAMASEKIDMITKRPRTPNDPYTCMTEEQIRANSAKANPSTYFYSPKPQPMGKKRYYMDRYATNTSQFLFRDQPRTHPVCWLGDKWQQQPPKRHETCRQAAALRWGPEKNGSRIYSHFAGEDTHRYLNIDVYNRPPTNLVGLVLQKHGRPGGSYYDQWHPHTTTWFGSSHILNQTDVLQDIRPKSMAEYQMKAEAEKAKALQRVGKFPEFSEYVDRYTVHSKVMPEMDSIVDRVEGRKKRILMARCAAIHTSDGKGMEMESVI